MKHLTLLICLAILCLARPYAFSQGGDNSNIADDSINFAILPFTATGQTICGRTNNYNQQLFPKQKCIANNYTKGKDYVYAFKPSVSGLIEITVTDTAITNASHFGVFLFRGTIESGTCVNSATGASKTKKISALLPNTDTFYVLVDFLSATQCFGYQISINETEILRSSKDCKNAKTICDKYTKHSVLQTGIGYESSELDSGSCLLSGEKNSIWYTFSIAKPGDLSFLITPLDNEDNFNFSLYSIEGNDCENKTLRSCNFSKNKGVTGLKMNGTLNTQDSNGTNFNSVVPVLQGDKFVLLVSKILKPSEGTENTTTQGFSLDFSNATAELLEISPVIQVSARLISSDSCTNDSIEIVFNQDVQRNSVQPDDFIIISRKKTDTINVTGISFIENTEANKKKIILSIYPKIEVYGGYHVRLEGQVIGRCGNSSIKSNAPLKFDSTDKFGIFILDEIDTVTNKKYIKLCASDDSPDSTYQWVVNGIPIETENSDQQCLITNAPGKYTVAYKDINGCFIISRSIWVRD